LALAILLAACSAVASDASTRAKLIGTWTGLSHNLELTRNSDGSFVSTFTREGLDYEFEGTWTVMNGVLIDRITANHSMNTKHTMHVGSFDTYKIVYVDSVMLVESAGGALRVLVHEDKKSERPKIVE
jgi:hypothetical protein